MLCTSAGAYDFTLSYLTPTAYWNPSYDIKVDNINSPLKLVYKAKLAQTSGIDWSKVKLILSTALPNQSGNAPVLSSWFLVFISPIVFSDKGYLSNSIQPMYFKLPAPQQVNVEGLSMRKLNIRGAESIKDTEAIPLYIVNGQEMSAEDFQKIDQNSIKYVNVLKGDQATAMYGTKGSHGVIEVTLKEEMQDYITVSDNQLNVSFDIDIPYDIQGNGKEQRAF